MSAQYRPPSRRRCPAFPLLLLLLPYFAGCASSPPPDDDTRWLRLPRAPYIVRVILPEATRDGGSDVLPLNSTRLERSILDEFERLRVCTAVEVTRADETPDGLPPDLELRIDAMDSPTYAFARRTGWFVPNAILWFFAGFPSFWVRDRVYGVDWNVRCTLSSIPAERELQVVALPLEQERALNITERGWTSKVLYTPPGLYEGPDTAAVLARDVESWLVAGLVEVLKVRAAALPFDVEIAVEPPRAPAPADATNFSAQELRVVIQSPRVLERVRVELDGSGVLEMDALNMMRAKRAPRGAGASWLEYPIGIPLALPAGEHVVRVFALRSAESDETGRRSKRPAWSASKSVRFTTTPDAAVMAPQEGK
jgi:hypothetical protein